MSYENAPATKLLATACAYCGRDLVDAVSVETGVGPECRKKYAIDSDASEEARKEANQIVFQLARKGVGNRIYLPAIERLAALGFEHLAARVAKRFHTTVPPVLSAEEVAACRKEYAKIRAEFCYDNGFSHGDFDAYVVSQGPRGAKQFVELAKEVTCMCKRCAGTGMFITYTENGQPKGPGGQCYRCAGKGHQTLEDARRNRAFDALNLARAC